MLRKHQPVRNKRRTRIILLDEALHDIRNRLSCRNFQVKMIAPDQFSVSDEEYLRDRIALARCLCLTFFLPGAPHGHGNHIRIVAAAGRHLLLLGDFSHRFDQIAV